MDKIFRELGELDTWYGLFLTLLFALMAHTVLS